MITDKQRRFLEKLLNGEITKEDNRKRYSETMIRIQKTIDEKLANTLWLAINLPDILKDEAKEFDDPDLERYRRFKAIAYIVSLLNPITEIENVKLPTVLRKLQSLYPKYYFKIIRKDFADRNEIS